MDGLYVWAGQTWRVVHSHRNGKGTIVKLRREQDGATETRPVVGAGYPPLRRPSWWSELYGTGPVAIERWRAQQVGLVGRRPSARTCSAPPAARLAASEGPGRAMPQPGPVAA